jgi:alanyl-tRNA synthetase
MNSSEIRQKYLEFFKAREHVLIPSASLLPENDSSLLFVNSGMFPLVPYLLGQRHPAGVPGPGPAPEERGGVPRRTSG